MEMPEKRNNLIKNYQNNSGNFLKYCGMKSPVFIRKKRKAELNQQLVTTILIIFLTVLLLIFAFKAYNMFKDKHREVIVADLEADMKGTVDLLSSKYGTIRQHTYLFPEGIDTVCFLDLNHSDVIMSNTTLTKEYPLINDSLAAGNNKNAFFIKKSEIIDSLYLGEICFDYHPFFSCIATPDNLLDVWFEGKKGCTRLYINWSMFPINYKNFTYYQDNPLFLVQEERVLGEVTNWRETLAIVPLTLFIEEETTYIFNYSVAYKSNLDPPLNIGNLEDLMDNHSTNKSYLFDNSYSGGSPIGYTIEYRSTKTLDYLDLWSNYSSLILVDYDNKIAAMMASLLSSYVNTPLIFINSSNLNTYKPIIAGRDVFIITHSHISLDDETFDFVKDYASRYELISDTLVGHKEQFPLLQHFIQKSL